MHRIKELTMITCFVVSTAPLAYGQSCPYGEPPTDYCSSPRVIPGDPGQHVVLMDVHNATAFDETLCGITAGHTVWFSVMPTVSGPMTISTCHPQTSYDTVLEVYTGDCEFLQFVACNDDTYLPECDNGCSYWGSVVTIDAVANENYRFVVGSVNENQAGCVLCLGVIVAIGEPCGDPPTNLGCQLARELPGGPGTHEALVDVTDAFVMLDEPQPTCGYNVGHTVWFSVTPAVDGSLTFSTCHPNTTYDTVLQAWTGDCTGLLYALQCNDDTVLPECDNGCSAYGSTVSFNATAGVEYFFQVGSYNNNSAGCELCLGVRLTIEDPCETETTPPIAEITFPPELGSGCTCEGTLVEGSAYDPDGTFDSYTLAYRQSGAGAWTVIASSTAPVVSGVLGTWDTTGLGEGYYLLRLTVANVCGMVRAAVQVVFLDKQFSSLNIRHPNDGDVVGQRVCLDGTVHDSWCFDHYTVEYRPAGGGSWSPVDPSEPVYTDTVITDPFAWWDTIALGLPDGDYELRVIAMTDCGNSATEYRTVTLDNTPPNAIISDPINCQPVDGMVQIVGTADDVNLDHWVLEYTGGNANGWVNIQSGSSPVINGVLANWNTSGLPACAYTLRLRVYDQAILYCNSAIRQWSEYTVSVAVGECLGDLDGDGDVDLTDLAALLAVYGTTCP